MVLRPQDPSPGNGLAFLLATTPDAGLRDAPRATLLAERVSHATHDQDPLVPQTVAAARAAGGRFPEAVETVNRALTLAEARHDDELAATLRGDLAVYQSGQPLSLPAGS